MYEHKHQRPIPRRAFVRRVVAHLGISLALVAASLLLGMWGYMHYEQLSWRDAFLNAAMLLGGMGPVDRPATNAGKLFAGAYALYAGLVFIACIAIVITPVVHRVMHRLHWEEEQ